MQVGGREFKQLLESTKHATPDVYAAFFSRIYNHDTRFNDWRIPLWSDAHTLLVASERRAGGQLITEENRFSMHHISQTYEHQFPLFFVEPDLLEACMNTNLPQGLKIADLKMPYEGFTFILPTNSFYSTEGSVPFITVSRDLQGSKALSLPPPFKGRELKITAMDDGLIIHTFFLERAGDFTVRVTDTLYAKDTPDINFHEHKQLGSVESLFKDDVELDKFTLKLLTLTTSLLLAMEIRPDLIERQRKIKHVRRDRNTEIWEPNRLGKRFRIQVEGGVEPGEHASPRTHWRRGHYRFQPIGHRNLCRCKHGRKAHDGFCMIPECGCKQFQLEYTEVEKKWIMPVLINASKEDKVHG